MIALIEEFSLSTSLPWQAMPAPRTLYDKIWDDHLVHEAG
jgi:hypothetical protein